LQKEKERLQKEIAKATQEVGKLEKKLGNNDFLLRAPEEVISKQRDRLTDNKSAVKNLQMSLNQLVGG
jgi:valyl-tRNA synthetase